MQEKFDYDVAFSFLAGDEKLATELNAALSERYRTFIYSERQKELSGKDGQQAFSEVYERQAAVVAVLYRPQWGETVWTRVEKNAIQSRSYEQAYEDFAFFIQLDQTAERAAWVPRRLLWYGIERFGVAGAVAAIDARIQELGQAPKVLTLADKAKAFKARADLEEARRTFKDSEQGVRAASAAEERLRETLVAKCAEVGRNGVHVQAKAAPPWFELLSSPIVLFLDAIGHYINRLESPRLRVEIWEGRPGQRRGFPGEGASCLETTEIDYELVAPDRSEWVVFLRGERREMSDGELAEFLIERFLANKEQVQVRRNRAR